MTDTEKPQLIAVQHRIPAAVKEWLAQQARAQERSANWVVCKLLTDAMKASQHDAAVLKPTSSVEHN